MRSRASRISQSSASNAGCVSAALISTYDHITDAASRIAVLCQAAVNCPNLQWNSAGDNAAHARSTTPMPPKPASSGGRASRPPTSRIASGLPRHRVSLPHRGRRSLEPAEPQPLLNADQVAPRLTDEGPMRKLALTIGETLEPVARLARRHGAGMRRAHRQHKPPTAAGLGDTARTPSAWPSGLVLEVAARLLVPRRAVDEHEPVAVARPTGMVFSQPPQVCSLRATGRVSDSVTQVMTSRSSSSS